MLEAIPNLYETEYVKDPVCHIKFFLPDSNWTWYIIELSQSDKTTCFGYVIGHEAELGYFNLSEIKEIKGRLGLAVECDISFIPVCLSEVKKGAK